MKNILVPIGNSENVKSHLQYAIDFASEFGAKLFLVQVFDIYTKAGTIVKVDEILRKESLNYLNELVKSVNTKNVNIEVHVFKGELVKTLKLACNALSIDLLMLEPKTNSKKQTLWLGKTSGKIVKKTPLPVLIVPASYQYMPIKRVLFALKNAKLKNSSSLLPLIHIQEKFTAIINLLLVKTPFYEENDFIVVDEIKSLVTEIKQTENATTFQGILEHYRENNPDMLCVVRRNRGKFSKVWEKNTITKLDFNSPVPVLVLNSLK